VDREQRSASTHITTTKIYGRKLLALGWRTFFKDSRSIITRFWNSSTAAFQSIRQSVVLTVVSLVNDMYAHCATNKSLDFYGVNFVRFPPLALNAAYRL
jgi:hypothetical protein